MGEDTTERGSSKCLILMFFPCSTFCLSFSKCQKSCTCRWMCCGGLWWAREPAACELGAHSERHGSSTLSQQELVVLKSLVLQLRPNCPSPRSPEPCSEQGFLLEAEICISSVAFRHVQTFGIPLCGDNSWLMITFSSSSVPKGKTLGVPGRSFPTK